MDLYCNKPYCEYRTSQGYCKFTVCIKKDEILYETKKDIENYKKPLVINLFGAPGAGKSTGAAIVFAELKKRGVNAELVTEFAKDKTWEGNAIALGC